MIRIENLTKNYGDVKAVQSISFSLKDGEVVGFLGANGAGKSTTLKMMTGYLTPLLVMYTLMIKTSLTTVLKFKSKSDICLN